MVGGLALFQLNAVPDRLCSAAGARGAQVDLRGRDPRWHREGHLRAAQIRLHVCRCAGIRERDRRGGQASRRHPQEYARSLADRLSGKNVN